MIPFVKVQKLDNITILGLVNEEDMGELSAVVLMFNFLIWVEVCGFVHYMKSYHIKHMISIFFYIPVKHDSLYKYNFLKMSKG